MNYDQLAKMASDGYLEVLSHIPMDDRPSVDDQIKDAFLSGFELLKDPLLLATLNAELLLDFIQNRSLMGELEEYLNESKLENWKNIKDKIKGKSNGNFN